MHRLPCCWKWHSSKLHNSRLSSRARRRSFFKSGLCRRISMSNERPRFSQPESHLPEKPLALTHAQINVVELFQVIGKESAIPQVLRVAEFPWVSPQIAVYGIPLFIAEPPRTSIPVSFMQTCEAALLKTLYPAFDRARVLSENIGHIVTGEAMSNQKNAVQPVVISGFLRSQNFLLHRNRHDLLIRDLEFSHVHALLPNTMAGNQGESNHIMRHYLCRGV